MRLPAVTTLRDRAVRRKRPVSGMGSSRYADMARRSVVRVCVAPVESSMISSEGMTLQPKLIGMIAVGGEAEPGFTTEVDGMKTTARIWARALTAVDGTRGLNTSEAAVAGEMLGTTSSFSRAPASS